MDETSPFGELVKELSSALDKSVQITNHHKFDDTFDGEEEEELYDYGGSEVREAKQHLNKYEGSPSPRKSTSPSSSEMEDEQPEPHVHEVENASFKLVSAMKGSREKLGLDQRKQRVTWAPDVHDPPPTSSSHVPRRGSKHQKLYRKDKRHGKRGHKGKDLSRGSGSNGAVGKDKKKKKKHYGQEAPANSNTRYQYIDAGNGLLDLKPDQVENFDMGIVDTSCGSSFLKTSLTKAHYPVAEAL